MGFGNIIITIFLIYYTIYFLSLTLAGKKGVVQENNKKLNTLRKIPIKSLQEQKEFLKIKNPEGKWKFSWVGVLRILRGIGISVLLYFLYSTILNTFNIVISLFWAIMILIVAPIIINLLLKKFDLETNDISVFFRGAK